MKIGFGSALGAVIGLMIAFAFFPTWWAGTLGVALGGIAGYVLVEPSDFLAAIASAWHEVMKKREPLFKRDYFSRLMWGFVASAAIMSIMMPGFYALLAVLMLIGPQANESMREEMMQGMFLIFLGGIPCMGFMLSSNRDAAFLKEVARECNILSALRFIFKKIPTAMRGIWRFMRLVVEKTLSNERMCALIGAATGTAIAFVCFTRTESMPLAVVVAGGAGFATGLGLSFAHKRVRSEA